MRFAAFVFLQHDFSVITALPMDNQFNDLLVSACLLDISHNFFNDDANNLFLDFRAAVGVIPYQGEIFGERQDFPPILIRKRPDALLKSSDLIF